MEELFNGDRQLPGGTFPEELTPFPEPQPQPQLQPQHQPNLGFFYSQPTALISPPVPQKLRPIRSNTRNPMEFPGPDVRRINGCNSSELGFLPFQPDLDSSAVQLMKMKSEMDAQLLCNFKSQISNALSCSSSDSESEPDISGDSSKRRKKRKKMESFLQGLMKQVIRKQEVMHQQLMEMIENKEKDRIRREEAWRKQEIERANRDHEIRAQEAARSVALISFIRNALGLPEDLMPTPVSVPVPIPVPVSPVPDPASPQGEGEVDHNNSNNKRWPTTEVQALITLRAALDKKFHNSANTKAPVWEEISAGMAKMGYFRNAKKCKEKWENLNKYYKRANANHNKHSQNCPYFHELETLYRNRLITTAKSTSPTHQHYGSTNT